MDEKEQIDPFTQQRKPVFKLPKKLWFVILAVPVTAWLVLLLCFGFDKATEGFSQNSYSVFDLVRTVFNPDADQGRSVVEAILNTMSVIFGLLITVIGIILQLSAVSYNF